MRPKPERASDYKLGPVAPAATLRFATTSWLFLAFFCYLINLVFVSREEPAIAGSWPVLLLFSKAIGDQRWHHDCDRLSKCHSDHYTSRDIFDQPTASARLHGTTTTRGRRLLYSR
jgi:hypothetical protein